MRQSELWQRRGVVLLGLAGIVVLLWAPFLFAWGSVHGGDGLLRVVFLNIGQGDAIFIETPDGVQALIDGGPGGMVLRELGAVMAVGDHSLDLLVSTHPDKDHIAGLVDVLDRFAVAHILRTENTSDTVAAQAFEQAVLREGAEVTYARAGQVWQLGASTTVVIYSPATDPREWESNTASIVAQLRYGTTEFMFTGDAPQSIEEYAVEVYGTQLQSEVLKLGHHGSRTSSSEPFLHTVNPLYAVVSAGKDNSYGHPHQEVVDRVHAQGAQLVSTVESGRLTFKSDGQHVEFLP